MSSSGSSVSTVASVRVLNGFADDGVREDHVKFIHTEAVVVNSDMRYSASFNGPLRIFYQSDTGFNTVAMNTLRRIGYDPLKINCFYHDSGIYAMVLPGSGHGSVLPMSPMSEFPSVADPDRVPNCEKFMIEELRNLFGDIFGCVEGFSCGLNKDQEYQTVKVLPGGSVVSDVIRSHAKVLQTTVKGLIKRFFTLMNAELFGSVVGRHMCTIGFKDVDPMVTSWVTVCGLIYEKSMMRAQMEIVSESMYMICRVFLLFCSYQSNCCVSRMQFIYFRSGFLSRFDSR